MNIPKDKIRIIPYNKEHEKQNKVSWQRYPGGGQQGKYPTSDQQIPNVFIRYSLFKRVI